MRLGKPIFLHSQAMSENVTAMPKKKVVCLGPSSVYDLSCNADREQFLSLSVS